jgi:hypothetical protein
MIRQLSIIPEKMVIVPFTQERDLRGLKEPTLSGHTLQLTTEVKIPWTYSGQGIDMEGTAEKCNE